MTVSTPLSRVEREVVPLAQALFCDTRAAVYVSTPITTGRSYFQLLRLSGSVPPPERSRIRLENANRAARVVDRVREAFPERRVINPLELNEPPSWTPDYFNGFWMFVIHKFVETLVVVDGWQYSVGCTWEVSQAMADGRPILDEHLVSRSYDQLVGDLLGATKDIDGNSDWMAARNEVLRHR